MFRVQCNWTSPKVRARIASYYNTVFLRYDYMKIAVYLLVVCRVWLPPSTHAITVTPLTVQCTFQKVSTGMVALHVPALQFLSV